MYMCHVKPLQVIYVCLLCCVEDDQFNDEKAYVIKQIKDLNPPTAAATSS